MIGGFLGPNDDFTICGTSGGPGRTRTSNQTVMSAVTLSEISMKSIASRYANQRMFTIGCGQSLAKRWLACADNRHSGPQLRCGLDPSGRESLAGPQPCRTAGASFTM